MKTFSKPYGRVDILKDRLSCIILYVVPDRYDLRIYNGFSLKGINSLGFIL